MAVEWRGGDGGVRSHWQPYWTFPTTSGYLDFINSALKSPGSWHIRLNATGDGVGPYIRPRALTPVSATKAAIAVCLKLEDGTGTRDVAFPILRLVFRAADSDLSEWDVQWKVNGDLALTYRYQDAGTWQSLVELATWTPATGTVYEVVFYADDSVSGGEAKLWVDGTLQASGAQNGLGGNPWFANADDASGLGAVGVKNSDYNALVYFDHELLIGNSAGYGNDEANELNVWKQRRVSTEVTPNGDSATYNAWDRYPVGGTKASAVDEGISSLDTTDYAVSTALADERQYYTHAGATSHGAGADDKVIGVTVIDNGVIVAGSCYLKMGASYGGNLDERDTILTGWNGPSTFDSTVYHQAPGGVDWTRAIFDATEFGHFYDWVSATPEARIYSHSVYFAFEVGGEPAPVITLPYDQIPVRRHEIVGY